MILINLLPEEYRKQRRTPLKMLAVVACGVAVNASLVAWWCWLAFGVTRAVETENAVLLDVMDSVGPQVAHYQELERESKQYNSREATLEDITGARVSWTRQVDVLVDLINMGGGGEKYLIWLDSLDVSTAVDQRSKTYGRLAAKAHSGSRDFAQLANFMDDVERSPLSGIFHPPAPPEGSQSKKDENLDPSEYWDFQLAMGLRAPEERQSARVEEGEEQ